MRQLTSTLAEALERDRLDMAVYEVEKPTSEEEVLEEDPTCWVASDDTHFSETDPFPEALFDRAC